MTVDEHLAQGWTEVTHLDLPTLVQRAFDLSRAQGMGWLHYRPADRMTREQAEHFIARDADDARFAVQLDYVDGRAVKFKVWRASDDRTRLFIEPSWYDHTDEQRAALLAPITQEA